MGAQVCGSGSKVTPRGSEGYWTWDEGDYLWDGSSVDNLRSAAKVDQASVRCPSMGQRLGDHSWDVVTDTAVETCGDARDSAGFRAEVSERERPTVQVTVYGMRLR